LDCLLITRTQGTGEGLETFAKGAEADYEETCPRLPAYPGEGREEAVDTLGVNELAYVHHQQRVTDDKTLESFTGIPVVGAGIVGARYLVERS
jgi:hypothetical protein